MPGVALNGVFFEPGTAERSGSFSYEALQDALDLGLDSHNAHVQPTGAYHYHSVPTGLVTQMQNITDADLLHLGWASDGFPMMYSVGNAYRTSYQLKNGERSSSPYGNYDGTFTQDFEYIADSGDLDDCNGITIDGQYVYLLTTDFPYISRCSHGTPDASFNKGPGSDGTSGSTDRNQPITTQPGAINGPIGAPQEAIEACFLQEDESSCSFNAPHGTVNGVCRNTPDGSFACVPQ